MSTAQVPDEQRLVLSGVSWQAYERVLRAFDDRHLRITYDRGALEIMTLSSEHERFKHLIGLLLFTLVEELNWRLAGFGSMTFKRRRKRRGLEPDECYWIQNEPAVRGKRKIDLKIDPPPDLVVEIEWTHSALDRLSIYAALSVSEVWHYDGQRLRVQLLGPDEKYADASVSRAFPFLPLARFEEFLNKDTVFDEVELVRQFRAWARERIAANWQ